jgi:Ca2+-binding EF-hand superfamily protein
MTLALALACVLASGAFAQAQNPPTPPHGPMSTSPLGGMGPMGGPDKLFKNRVVDENKDGMVSAEEAAKHESARFESMDKNKDGALDADEMGLRAGGAKDDARANRRAAMFKAMDADGDGKVTKAEFDAHHAERFKKADKDGDGKIPAKDYPRGM